MSSGFGDSSSRFFWGEERTSPEVLRSRSKQDSQSRGLGSFEQGHENSCSFNLSETGSERRERKGRRRRAREEVSSCELEKKRERARTLVKGFTHSALSGGGVYAARLRIP